MLSKNNGPSKIEAKVVSIYDDYIPDFYRIFECDSNNVVETLTPELEFWNTRNPVLIHAPPGRGKTTFANEVAVRRAIQGGKTALIISNRVAVSTQQKLKIMELIQSPLRGRLTDEGIRKTERFGPVSVITYHRLPAFLRDPENEKWIRNIGVVIADEIHILSADSKFNNMTECYVNLLTRRFQHAVRIYMSATPEEVLVPLAEAEKRNYRDISGVLQGALQRDFLYYHFPADYSHVNLQFFDELGEIADMINTKPQDKWLVFVSSKPVGKAFAKELGSRALYLDAESKETDEWNDLLKTSDFKQQVLVTTAVLDSGANIWSEELHNVVIMTDNKTSLIQMLGRKRLKPGEQVNVYVMNLDMKAVGRRQMEYGSLVQWYDRYLEATSDEREKMAVKFWRDSDDSLRHYFSLTRKGKLVPNEMAFFALRCRMHFYTSLLIGEVSFQKAVKGWLGLPEGEEVPPKDRLLHFCEIHCDQELNDQEQAEFRKLVVLAVEHEGHKEPRPERIEKLQIEALQNRLSKISFPYRLERNKWIIREVGAR